MSKIKQKFESALSNAKGTAGEAYQMYHYDQMVEEFGTDGADTILKKPLQRIGVSLEEFHTYRKVRGLIMNGELNIAKANQEANKLTQGVQEDLAM